jgi:hypothetical protein
MDWNLPKPPRFYVPELLLLIRFVTAEPVPAISSLCRVSAGLAISASNSRTNLAIA